jgi:hypothetical protein
LELRNAISIHRISHIYQHMLNWLLDVIDQ